MLDAVIVGLDLLMGKESEKKMQKRLFIVTDLCGETSGEEDVQVVVEQLQKLSCKLNVLTWKPNGREREEERGGSEEMMEKMVERVKGVKVSVEEAIELMSYLRAKSVLPRPTFQGFLQIGPLSPSSLKEEEAIKGGKEGGEEGRLELKVFCHLKTKQAAFPTLSKLSLLSSPSNPPNQHSPSKEKGEEEKGERKGERGERDVDERNVDERNVDERDVGERDVGGRVKMKRRYECILQPSIQVEKSKLSKGYRYGKTLVPFDAIDEQVLEYKSGEKCLRVIGFCEMDAVPREHFLSSSELVLPDPSDLHSCIGVSALAEAMAHTKSLAIVRYVKRKNAKVQLGVLLPLLKQRTHCFVYNKLPFSEDLRHFRFPSLLPLNHPNFPNPRPIPSTPSSQQLLLTQQLIFSLDLENPPSSLSNNNKEGDSSSGIPLLKPKHTYNPAIQHFYQSLQHRALASLPYFSHNNQNREEEEEEEEEGVGASVRKGEEIIWPKTKIGELDELINSYVEPSPLLLESASEKMKRFKESFLLSKVENSKTGEKSKKRTFWADIFAENINKPNSLSSYLAGEANKKQKLGKEDIVSTGENRIDSNSDKTHFSIQSILSSGVDSVGSVSPVEDFNNMIERRDVDLVEVAIEQIKKVIFQLIDDSLGNQLYKKALEAIEALRRGCIKEEESSHFNDFLEECKQFYKEKRRDDFWQFLKKNKIFPISFDESDDSNLSSSQALSFYETENKSKSNGNQTTNKDEEDDEIEDLWSKIE